MSASEARAFRRRWRLVHEAERQELRRTPLATKFRQLATLMASADLFGRDRQRALEEKRVRALWMRLRRESRA